MTIRNFLKLFKKIILKPFAFNTNKTNMRPSVEPAKCQNKSEEILDFDLTSQTDSSMMLTGFFMGSTVLLDGHKDGIQKLGNLPLLSPLIFDTDTLQ